MIRLISRHRIWVLVASVFAWILLAWLDLRFGLKIRLGPFYAIPVMLMAWYFGRKWGMVAGFLSASLWHLIQRTALTQQGYVFFRHWDY